MRIRNFVGPIVLVLVFGGYALKSTLQKAHFRTEKTEVPLEELPFRLDNITDEAGIDHRHEPFEIHDSLKNVASWLSAFSASVAVVDYDNDGWQDLYFNNARRGSQNHLYRNLGNGQFEETAVQAGIADVNREHPSTRPLFFDCDQDGDQDLVLISRCPQLFSNQGDGTFTNTTAGSGLQGCLPHTLAANVHDMDGDGQLDLMMGAYFDQDVIDNPDSTRVMPGNFHNAANSAPFRVFRGLGNCRFSLREDNFDIKTRGWHFAIGVHDMANDGDKVIWIASDYGTDVVYKGNPADGYVNISDAVHTDSLSRNSMNIDIADVDNDGQAEAYTSQIYFPREKTSGNLLWEWDGNNRFSEQARTRGVHDCGWSWGGKFVDLDNDSRLDIAVANGFINANPRKHYWYYLAVVDAAGREFAEDISNWPALGDYSLAGYQRGCLFFNAGDRFYDVSPLTPFGKNNQAGRAVATVDLLNNGSLDVVVANQNGTASVYRNTQINQNRWIGFKLAGVQNNRDAFGARIRIALSDRVLMRELQPMNGFASQSDARLHFGLGADDTIQKIEIIWPNGQLQKLNPVDYQTNRYHPVRESTPQTTALAHPAG